jgi:RNA chaperone Hfq
MASVIIRNIQKEILSMLINESKLVDINFVNRNKTRLRGVIKGFDAFTIIVESFGVQHTIYKHEICNISSLAGVRNDRDRNRPRNRNDNYKPRILTWKAD